MLHGSGKGACMGYSSKSFSGWIYMYVYTCSLVIETRLWIASGRSVDFLELKECRSDVFSPHTPGNQLQSRKDRVAVHPHLHGVGLDHDYSGIDPVLKRLFWCQKLVLLVVVLVLYLKVGRRRWSDRGHEGLWPHRGHEGLLHFEWWVGG